MSNKKDKDKKNNILNFVNKSKENKKIQTEDDEIKRMDDLAKELVDVYYKASKKSFLSVGNCFYLFIYRVLQKMIATNIYFQNKNTN
jgi:hypothetical protein